MSWVKWLKDKSGLRTADEKKSARTAPAGRRPRKGGDAYAKEWLKVLEDTDPAIDPYGTYSWELKPDATGATPARPGRKPKSNSKPAAKPARKPAPNDEFDTYSWELQQTSSREDPWGLGKDAPQSGGDQPGAGGNPYDTGIFKATWTGRFDQR